MPSQVSAYDPNTAKLNLLKQELGIVAAADAEQLITGSDITLLAVKPNVCASVLSRLAEPLTGKALISIAAGWSQQRLANLLPGLRSRFASHAEYAGFGRVRDVGI